MTGGRSDGGQPNRINTQSARTESMGWSPVETTERYDEWERADGFATIRLREHADGSVVVRVDRLEQAPDGRGYRRQRVADRETAEALVAEWKTEFDHDDEA